MQVWKSIKDEALAFYIDECDIIFLLYCITLDCSFPNE